MRSANATPSAPRRWFLRIEEPDGSRSLFLEADGSQPLCALMPDIAAWRDWNGGADAGVSCSLETEAGGELFLRRSLAEQSRPGFLRLRFTSKESTHQPFTNSVPAASPPTGLSSALIDHPEPASPLLRHPSGEEFPLPAFPVVIGRRTQSVLPDIDLSRWDSRGAVSRRHAAIEPRGEEFSVLALSETNGTRLNGKDLPPGEAAPLRDGDRIEFGAPGLELIFRQRRASTRSAESERTRDEE